MPITQIPFQDPVAPPEKPEPEQLGLYDTREWETAYRDLDARVPHLLIQLQDDLARSRRREAAWISIITHLLLLIALAKIAALEKYIPASWRSPVPVSMHDLSSQKNLTYLQLPPDLQKVPRKPKTNIISDKDRIAMSRHPELDKDFRKAPPTPPPGAPGSSGPRAPQPAQQPPAMAQNQPQQQQPSNQRPVNDPNLTAQLQLPQKSNNTDFSKYAGSMSAGAQIQEATRGVAQNRRSGVGGQEGDFGLGTGARGRQQGALEILSDTQGVDFGPYLQRILQEVKEHWYSLIPESAQMKKGKLAIEFAITKDGQVAGMKLVATSGDTALDRAAWGGITASNPFPPLPTDFGGQYLSLRFRFFYNPDKADLE